MLHGMGIETGVDLRRRPFDRRAGKEEQDTEVLRQVERLELGSVAAAELWAVSPINRFEQNYDVVLRCVDCPKRVLLSDE